VSFAKKAKFCFYWAFYFLFLLSEATFSFLWHWIFIFFWNQRWNINCFCGAMNFSCSCQFVSKNNFLRYGKILNNGKIIYFKMRLEKPQVGKF
jgi:hypothetical protein